MGKGPKKNLYGRVRPKYNDIKINQREIIKQDYEEILGGNYKPTLRKLYLKSNRSNEKYLKQLANDCRQSVIGNLSK